MTEPEDPKDKPAEATDAGSKEATDEPKDPSPAVELRAAFDHLKSAAGLLFVGWVWWAGAAWPLTSRRASEAMLLRKESMRTRGFSALGRAVPGYSCWGVCAARATDLQPFTPPLVRPETSCRWST